MFREAGNDVYTIAGGVRELNITLIEMAHANTEAVFDLVHEIASAEAPSDLAAIWPAHAKTAI
jgi:hypothetical protein